MVQPGAALAQPTRAISPSRMDRARALVHPCRRCRPRRSVVSSRTMLKSQPTAPRFRVDTVPRRSDCCHAQAPPFLTSCLDPARLSRLLQHGVVHLARPLAHLRCQPSPPTWRRSAGHAIIPQCRYFSPPCFPIAALSCSAVTEIHRASSASTTTRRCITSAITDGPQHSTPSPPTVGRDAVAKRSPQTASQPAGTAASVCHGRPINDTHHQPPFGFATNLTSFAQPPWCSPTPPSTLMATGQPAPPLFPFGHERLHTDHHRRSLSGAATASTSFSGSPCASPAAQASNSTAPPLPHRHPLRPTVHHRG
jgi:hypothetical protein